MRFTQPSFLFLLLPAALFLALAVAAIGTGAAALFSAFSGFAVFADIMVVLGAALVPLALGLDYLLTHAAVGLALPRADEDQLDRLFGVPSLTLASSVAIAVAAGVGEELAVRGVLQPRLGLVFANLFFAAGHALQYSIDGVISVFLLGLVFGVLRRRTSTIASMAGHAVYDLTLFVLILAGV